MLPSLPHNNFADLFLAQTKRVGDGGLFFASFESGTDGSDIIYCESSFSANIGTGKGVAIFNNRIGMIAAACGPFEIFRAIVGSIMIYMSNFRKILWIWNKGEGNRLVATELSLFTCLVGKAVSQISIFVGFRRKNASGLKDGLFFPHPSIRDCSVKTSYSAEIAHFVNADISRHWTPLFLRHFFTFDKRMARNHLFTGSGAFCQLEALQCR